MSRVLHGMPIGSLPEPGELKSDDQIIAYRSETGDAYRSDIKTLGGITLDDVYPVGSIYMSIVEGDPARLFGGEWEQLENCFLLAAGSNHGAGTTGGAETVALTSAQLPSHTHSLPSHTHSTPSHTHSIPRLSGTAASAGSHTHSMNYYANAVASGSNYSRIGSGGESTSTNSINSAGAHTHSVTTSTSTTGSSSGTSGSTSGTSGSTGSGNSHDNMPPYLAVYMWQRIA